MSVLLLLFCFCCRVGAMAVYVLLYAILFLSLLCA